MPEIKNSQTDGEPLPAKSSISASKREWLRKRAASQGRSFGYQGK